MFSLELGSQRWAQAIHRRPTDGDKTKFPRCPVHTLHRQTPARPQPQGGKATADRCKAGDIKCISANRTTMGTDDHVRSSPLNLQGGRMLYATPRQTCPRPRSRAQIAFKDSMIHGILQFTLSIAFRYVLHRNESRDIRCRESFASYFTLPHGDPRRLARDPRGKQQSP